MGILAYLSHPEAAAAQLSLMTQRSAELDAQICALHDAILLDEVTKLFE